tara:strand:+ start:219 stop:824 length:606 start_codon:yes stop_codon:yes gene_type:complete
MSSKGNIVIGVTGSIGSGKSTVSGFFQKWGGVLIDADSLAHEFIATPEIVSAVKNQYGAEIMDGSGNVWRTKLGAVVFRNRNSLKKYYNIIKEPLIKIFCKRLEEAKLSHKIVVFDAPLLFEWKLEEFVNTVVTINADRELCIKRASDRSSLSRSEIEDRMTLQLEPNIKRSRADYFIKNDGGIDDLRECAKVVWSSIQAN